MIKSLHLQNFTNFQDLKIDFSDKINVIIGENGTGKTNLLRAIYSQFPSERLSGHPEEEFTENLSSAITETTLGVFKPLDGKLGRLRRHGVSENASISTTFIREGRDDTSLKTTFHTNSKTIAIADQKKLELYKSRPVFIPTKEVLSFMYGFTSLYEKRELSFDQTYADICLQLDLPPLRQDKMQEKSKWAIEEIQEICKGRFIFSGGGKVTFKTKDDLELSANAMAEGFRKAGMLARLLETGSIEPGVSGPLIWDEPEANLNPKLLKTLVKILSELASQGQQVILSTHNYILLKRFDLIDKELDGLQVRYHSLSYSPDTEQVVVHSTDDYDEIPNNPIDEAFESILNEEIFNELGEL